MNCSIHKCIFNRYDLPVSQSLPVYPVPQVQVYVFSWSVQVPPFLHGWLAHSSISGMKITDTVIT